MPGVWINDSGAQDNQYKYNGKELNGDFGLGWYAYGFRYYDPNVARFWSVDPLATKYPHYTPYQFAGNRVPNAIDLEGLEEYLVIYNYDSEGHKSSVRINYHKDSNGNLVNQQLRNSATKADYSKSKILVVHNKGKEKEYQTADKFDGLAQETFDKKEEVSKDRAPGQKNNMSGGLDSGVPDNTIESSHSKSATIGIDQEFEFRFEKGTLDKPSAGAYLNSISKVLNSDDVPIYKIEGQDNSRIKEELQKRDTDQSKETTKMNSNKPLGSASRILYGKYKVN
jgi:RHS repeat-associated protein